MAQKVSPLSDITYPFCGAALQLARLCTSRWSKQHVRSGSAAALSVCCSPTFSSIIWLTTSICLPAGARQLHLSKLLYSESVLPVKHKQCVRKSWRFKLSAPKVLVVEIERPKAYRRGAFARHEEHCAVYDVCRIFVRRMCKTRRNKTRFEDPICT